MLQTQRECARRMSDAADDELDRGAEGPAALARPSRLVTVLGDRRSVHRSSGVEVRRYIATQLDALRHAKVITYEQYTAGRHATALWRAAAIAPVVTSRYSEWVSGARGKWVSTDDSQDEAQPWRDLVTLLPPGPGRALEALMLGVVTLPDSLPHLREALDRVAHLLEI